MATVKLLSNAQVAGGTGGVTVRRFYGEHKITAGTSVTGLPVWSLPNDVTSAMVTDIGLDTGSTAPTGGTMTVQFKKNGSTNVASTDVTVTTTAGVNTSINSHSAATTGYQIPVMASPLVTLAPGDQLSITISGGATVTLQRAWVEITDTSGIS